MKLKNIEFLKLNQNIKCSENYVRTTYNDKFLRYYFYVLICYLREI